MSETEIERLTRERDEARDRHVAAHFSLSAALAEIERLRNVLEPFKHVSEYFDVDTEGFADADELSLMPKGTDFELYTLTVGDFRRAALSPTPPEKA